MNKIKIFCPASVANVSCGFDVIGFCLDPIGDEMIIRKTAEKGIRITKIEGQDLPLEAHNNVAGVAGLALLEAHPSAFGFEIEIIKGIKAGSGIGSSAASSAGAVFGINELLGRPFTRGELIQFAMKGEELASGTPHADNVAPVLLGGFTLVRCSKEPDVIGLPSPSELYATVLPFLSAQFSPTAFLDNRKNLGVFGHCECTTEVDYPSFERRHEDRNHQRRKSTARSACAADTGALREGVRTVSLCGPYRGRGRRTCA